MDIALTAQLYQNIYAQPSNLDITTTADDIRSFFGLASGALMAAGEAFKQIKDNLSRGNFADWLNDEGFVPADASKFIKLFEHFGNTFDNLTTVSPLSLMRLLAPTGEDARNALFDMVEEYREIDEVVTSQELETLRKVHSPPPKQRTPKRQDESNLSESVIKMVGNQPGGTGILRLEVKNHELANQLDNEWKQSGYSVDQWMQFMSASTDKIQEIAQVVLGRKIVDVSELPQLDVVIQNIQIEKRYVGVELEIPDFEQTLPYPIIDSLNHLYDLDEHIASCNNPLSQRMYHEERTEVLSELKILAAEYQLDIDSLLWHQQQELARC